MEKEKTSMFIHEKCGSIIISMIPNQALERLRCRQDEQSPFKYRFDNDDTWGTLIIMLIGIGFILAPVFGLAKTGVKWDLVNYPFETVFPFISILGILMIELMLRINWLQEHSPLQCQSYLTPIYLVVVEPARINFYPLVLIEGIKTVHEHVNNAYRHSTTTIKFKDGTSFEHIFKKENQPDLVTAKINELRQIFYNKIIENDEQWLIDMDDFKFFYDNTDFYEKQDTSTLKGNWVDLLIILSNLILVFLLALLLYVLSK